MFENAARTRVGSRAGASRAHRAGLTLIEVLVVLLVVAVVAGIALVALRSARTSASETRQLADLRSGAALFASWSHDRSEEFLNLQRDPQRYAMRCEPWRGSHYCVYWESQWHRWNTVYFWTTIERSPVQGFLYSFTFVSDPAMWSLNPGPERLGHAARRHFRPVRARGLVPGGEGPSHLALVDRATPVGVRRRLGDRGDPGTSPDADHRADLDAAAVGGTRARLFDARRRARKGCRALIHHGRPRYTRDMTGEKRTPWALLLAGSLAVLLVGIVAVIMMRSGSPQPVAAPAVTHAPASEDPPARAPQASADQLRATLGDALRASAAAPDTLVAQADRLAPVLAASLTHDFHALERGAHSLGGDFRGQIAEYDQMRRVLRSSPVTSRPPARAVAGRVGGVGRSRRARRTPEPAGRPGPRPGARGAAGLHRDRRSPGAQPPRGCAARRPAAQSRPREGPARHRRHARHAVARALAIPSHSARRSAAGDADRGAVAGRLDGRPRLRRAVHPRL